MTAWTDNDLHHMRSLGMDPSVVSAQLELFRSPPPPIRLHRCATVGDGIRVLAPSEIQSALKKYEEARAAGRFQKFVPASGAASRMFQALSRALLEAPVRREHLERKARGGHAESGEILRLMESFHRLAFSRKLRLSLESQGHDFDSLLAQGDYTPILEFLLSPGGMDYSRKPKGLIPFHRGAKGELNPLVEQLREAALTVADAQGRVRVHFTVSPEHLGEFERQAGEALSHFGKEGLEFEITFSVQKPSTDTPAAEVTNEPFRDEEGRLLFRPGGHGALLENLNDLQGDLVYIKNIDNVAREAFLESTIFWKKILGGVLVQFAEERRARKAPEVPLRVCGVVRNTGEPGGGPFWVLDREGGSSLQIVESSQLDKKDQDQKRIFEGSSHFNPVDLVCSLRNNRGEPFDLRKFVDPEAVFISGKSHLGRDLKALELPGLWNGAMAGWGTLFVEVPLETFNPVKTVFDLLKPAHSDG